jgi:hypothetical protein
MESIMSLEEILQAIDKMQVNELRQVRLHLEAREAALVLEPDSMDEVEEEIEAFKTAIETLREGMTTEELNEIILTTYGDDKEDKHARADDSAAVEPKTS